VASASFGPPDLRLTSLNNVCDDARRISGVTDLPLPADGDTGRSARIAEQRAGDRPIRRGAGCIGPGRREGSAPEAR
jgi:methylisocitrate lyase